MFLMDFIPDYKIAQDSVHDEGSGTFGTYSMAYTVSNEDLRKTMRFVPKKCDNALVVAASGDHPLFCSLYGAKHVDTFDVSYNAKCFMDIKVEAIKKLGYIAYLEFLKSVYMLKVKPFCTIKDVKYMPEILEKIPKIESEYIYALQDKALFSRGAHPISAASRPSVFEYYKMRAKVKEPYNFIMSDACNLSAYLTKSYDFIHLSNIFDYIPGGKHQKIIAGLMEHVNVGGRIVTQCVNDGYDEVFGFYMYLMSKRYNNWKFEKKFIETKSVFQNGVWVLERTR